ncbi:c-type cytochrome biogenesis protein CcmI [Sulfitobacter sp. G21635-S1]|uniref:c-type cytochrome biogenesis protein CcmI n=1 Tax=Sulfitobacter sp. G21635-S1 TaxID=3014043 RepID=UPI0022B02753|nr:c-type cytochrome biogenesis protein CcmI [Sulfitobacter sp. G21635-S1]MCZ4256881.1 c-type cytochrome biogenesis protein CcmI [Sulfitobacter sp. G21635-S1]
MTFWIITCAMAIMVAALLGRAMARGARAGTEDAASYDLRVYRDQLAEVERDVARGVIPAEDAERARTEISRRILAVGSTAGKTPAAGRGSPRVLYGLLALVVVAGSLLLYRTVGAPGYGDLGLADRIAFAEEMRENRPSQQTAEESLPPMPAEPGITEEFQTLMTRLRETVATRPEDLQGHRLLASNEARIGNFSAAAVAQQEVLRIKGESATAADYSDYGEFLILAAGGYVSPQAETALRAALARDAQDGRARYYVGLMMVQTGRPDVAFRIWDGLLRRGPEDSPWIAPIRAQIMPVAALAGVDYEMPQPTAARGPSAEDIEAAAEMSAQDRMEMIGGMVAGLSDRLATEGGPATDWARLITSLAVLDRAEEARRIYDNALEVFDGDAAALDIISRAGQQAGVAE